MSSTGRGFSLMEAGVVLLSMSAVGATLLPRIQTDLDKAKVIRAREEVQVISYALNRYLSDTGECAVWFDSNNNTEVGIGAEAGATAGPERHSANRVDLMVSAGKIPAVPDAVEDVASGGIDGTVDLWKMDPEGSNMTIMGGRIATMSDILVTNTPGGSPAQHARYMGDHNIRSNYGSRFDATGRGKYNQPQGWQGPYITEATADPWGNRYMVNTRWKDCVQGENAYIQADGSDGSDNDTFVLSAGPNEQVQTPFSTRAVLAGDDDVVALVSSVAAHR